MDESKPRTNRTVNRSWRRDTGGAFHDARKERFAQLRVTGKPRTAAGEEVGIAEGTATIWDTNSAMMQRVTELRGGTTRVLPVSRGYLAVAMKRIVELNTVPPENDDPDVQKELRKHWRPDYMAAIGASKELLKMIEHEEKASGSKNLPAPMSLPSGKQELRKTLMETLGAQPIKATVGDG